MHTPARGHLVFAFGVAAGLAAAAGLIAYAGRAAAQSPPQAGGKKSAGSPKAGPAKPAPAKAAPAKKGGRRAASVVVGPADYNSAHFLLHTDLDPKAAQELLKRLETMLDLISKYWARPSSGIIEMYVVEDLQKWTGHQFDPAGLAKIEEGAGVTITESATLGFGPNKKVLAKSVVYAVADRGTPQHEAVHAYCGQTFGTCGPLWYAEGMAEMGQYWRHGEQSVQIHDVVLDYLKRTRPQTMREIVHARSATGDSWQNYAWRWALCHLLANNANYRDRFRPLGTGFLTEQPVSFEETYGAMAREIEFEYLFFLRHIDQGFRCDLCSWDWKKKFKPLTGTSPVTAKVAAAQGWQASGVTCVAGQPIELSAAGTWQLGKDGAELSADGDAQGAGRLVGALMGDYKLGDEFELSSYGPFTPPSDGKLFLRCRDTWNSLADNKGALTVKLKLEGKGSPLPRPKPADKKSTGSGNASSGSSAATSGKPAASTAAPKPVAQKPAPQKPAPADSQ